MSINLHYIPSSRDADLVHVFINLLGARLMIFRLDDAEKNIHCSAQLMTEAMSPPIRQTKSSDRVGLASINGEAFIL